MMVMTEYLVAIGAVLAVLVFMFVAFKMSGSVDTADMTKQKASSAKPKPQISEKRKKKLAAKEREEAREQAELEAILEREISRNPGMSADTKTTQPKTLEENTKKNATQKKTAAVVVSTKKKDTPAEQRQEQQRDSNGFKPVLPNNRAPKKEKARPPPTDFEIDEEMEKKLAAFFNRSDRRNKGGFSTIASAVHNEPENRGSYVRIKEDFSTDSKW